MTILEAITLGVVQGITEFLPISSSGHLIIFPKLFGWPPQPLAFDTFLHLGTAAAILIYFWNDLVSIVSAFFSDFFNYKFRVKKYSKEGYMGIIIMLGSLPAVVLGVLFEELIESTFRGITWVSIFLIIGSILLFCAEKWFSSKNEEIDLNKGVFVGLMQSLALLPGMSRSGATISAGMFSGLSREQAARFSFLLSVPVIVGAGLYKAFLSGGDLNAVQLNVLASGFISSFLVGILAIKFLLTFVKENKLFVFVIYRVLLAVFLLTFI